MERFIYYKYAYVVSLPIMLIALFWYPFVYVYGAVFFFASIWLIIEQTRIPTYADSSAATHYEVYSRFNNFNYYIAGYLILASIFTAIFLNTFIVFILWTVLIVAFQILIPRYLPRLHLKLIVDYIMEQLPDIHPQIIEAVVFAKINNPELTPEVIKDKWKLDLPIVSSILGYYHNYLKRNSEMFNFIPAFIRSSEDIPKHIDTIVNKAKALTKKQKQNETKQPEVPSQS